MLKSELVGLGQKKTRGIDRLMILPVFFPCFFVFLTGLSGDVWFLLNHGRYLLEKGFPVIEPFTLHGNLNFVMQQWFSSLLYWLAYVGFGAFGVQLLVLFASLLGVALFYLLVKQRGVGNRQLGLLSTLAFAYLFSPFMTARPYVLVLPIFLLELICLEAWSRGEGKQQLWLLPFLSILLVNLQGALWPMALLILLPYALDSFSLKLGVVSGEKKPLAPLGLAALGMVLGGFLNPYGLRGMTYLFTSLGSKELSLMIREMSPATLGTETGVLIFLLLLVVFFSYLLYPKGRIPLRHVLLVLGMGVLSLMAIRGFYFLLLTALPALAWHYQGVRFILPKRLRLSQGFRGFLLLPILGLLLFSGLDQGKYLKAEERQEGFLREALVLVLQDQSRMNVVLYGGFEEGALAEFLGLKPYIDPRAEVFLKSNNGQRDILAEYYQLLRGKLGMKSFVDAYAFTHLVFKREDPLRKALELAGGYEVVYENQEYALYRMIGGWSK